MFSAAIVLRYKMPKKERPFALGKKTNAWMWIIAGLGFCGALLAFVLSFVPPSQIDTGNNTTWFTILVIGCVIFVAIPFIIYAMRKPSWKDPNAVFQPFHWEIPSETQTATVSASIPVNPVSQPNQAPNVPKPQQPGTNMPTPENNTTV